MGERHVKAFLEFEVKDKTNQWWGFNRTHVSDISTTDTPNNFVLSVGLLQGPIKDGFHATFGTAEERDAATNRLMIELGLREAPIHPALLT